MIHLIKTAQVSNTKRKAVIVICGFVHYTRITPSSFMFNINRRAFFFGLSLCSSILFFFIMLASIPISVSNTPSYSRRYYHDWPLNEIEENVMTLATCSQINQQPPLNNKLRRSTVVRCSACHRKFHSVGNLANHQQLYQH
jgi:hypothetical protein